ncbi:pilus assembly protein [Undibacterium sp. TJN19]|uniref:pilus assembly protein n=1 Tax=Undibacterium sp. TJN19 TaxID=3413055 RepID=UPI003BEF74B8
MNKPSNNLLVKLRSPAILAGVMALLNSPVVGASPIVLSQTPLFVTNAVLPNVLVVLDNSESMDGTMAGKLIAGDDATTRSNIARSVMRDTITNYRTAFKWGLMSFDVTSSNFYVTYAYFLGSDAGMTFTDGCSGSPLKTSGGKPCITNPQPFAGASYITYDSSGDDASINDVLYTSSPNAGSNECNVVNVGGLNYCSVIWGINNGAGKSYYFRGKHNVTTSWNLGDFTGNPLGAGAQTFSETDAGYVPSNPPITRQVYIPRAWGYGGTNSGKGKLNEAVIADSTAHYNNLMSYLATETSNTGSSEIKNNSTFTPLPGTLQSVKTYFTGGSSPVQYACQKNFVMLVTDGMATATNTGAQYTAADRAANKPLNDTVAAIAALRNTTPPPTIANPDIKTYVVGLGDTVQNPTAVSGLNSMAGAGGTGSAFLASDPTAFSNAIQAIANNITAQVGSASAVSLNSTQINSGSALFQGKFSSIDWSGQLLSYPVTSTGGIGALSWDAGQVLNGQNWNSGRIILTNNLTTTNATGRGVAFRWPSNPAAPTSTEINLSQVTALNKNASGTADAQGQLRLQYIRGDRTNEGASPLFRARTRSVLGDIVDSNSVYVGKPPFTYPNSLESAKYVTFAQNKAGRTPMVYVGANDGMLHGFSALDGSEKIAYVPTQVYSNLSKLTDPSYAHRFFVDGSPNVGDVFYGGAWHSVLVGSLRGGGQGIFALDVTDPSNFSEANAASTVLWEFNDADDGIEYDLGYSYTQPMIVKMANGKWAAIFGNGYNNTIADGKASATGNAAIYIVDIQTGALIKKLYTNTGSASTPNGIGSVTPVDVNGDSVVDYIYAGDLQGNVWKFDVTSTLPAAWGPSFGTVLAPLPLFIAKDSTNKLQPITGKITVGRNPVSGYMVYFGTGQYLGVPDLTDTSQQSFYGIWDNGATVSGRSVLQGQTISTSTSTTVSGTFRTSTSNAIAATMYTTGAKKGWYTDLPTSGERQVTDPLLNDSNIVFSTLIPSTDPCAAGGSGWIMELDSVTGNMISDPIFPTTSTTEFSSSDMATAGVQTASIPSTPRVINKQGVSYGNTGNTGGNTSGGGGGVVSAKEKKLTSQSDGSIGNQTEKAAITQKRVMWRQIQQ